ncbi:ATP-binding response regulator [Noviherbaspirillum autotrophicum]|uniref:ATP-binding response regulator n=1 Tax=Noviherbaspirillum autotrophicum TaxID=709839 RepID=UPI000694574D|nr:hybrid sensor histidine kinase/response regulator [Noviherbaspirillum autotrophicum]
MFNPKAASDRATGIAVMAERIALWQSGVLHQQVIYAACLHVLAAVVLFALLRPQPLAPAALHEFAFAAGVWAAGTAGCYGFSAARFADKHPARAPGWFCTAVSLWALAWAAAFWQLLPLVPGEALLAIILLLAAGTALALAASFAAMACFTLFLLLPFAAHLLTGDIRSGLSLGLVVLALLPLYLALCRRLNQIVLENCRLRIESEQTSAQLRETAGAEAVLRERTEQALRVAEQACADKTRFLAAASHDLRQPVHAISLFVAALKLENFDTRAKYLVDRLDRSLAGLDELFNRLLDISRIDAGVITPSVRVFEAHPIGQTLETRFAPLAASKSLRFHVHCPKGLFLHTDAELLIELIMNLLSNAFRYTERGGVLLAFRARQDKVLVQVWDSGCGIPEDHLDRIFDEFVQLGNPSRDRRKGLGLGLAIVKRLSGILGCVLRVRSVPGKGSVFELEVARSTDITAADYAATQGEQAEHDLSGMLVLVVDDEIDILAAMEAILSSWGCYAILARSIDEALKYVDASLRYPDVLITDHRLGDHKTSFDAVRAVSSVVPYEIPVIVISGEANSALEREVQDMGWLFMNKPVNAASLYRALQQALAIGRKEFPQVA